MGNNDINTDKRLYQVVLGKNICFLRKAHNITQQQLASILVVSQSSVVGYEKGTTLPSFAAVIDLSNYFGVDIDTLINITLDNNNYPSYVKSFSMLPDEIRRFGFFDNIGDNLGKFADKSYHCYFCETDFNKHLGDKKHKAAKICEGFLVTDKATNPRFINVSCELGKHEYIGKLICRSTKIYIYLDNESRNERCLIMLPYQPSSKEDYLGGMGCILSLSTGEDPTPCFQYIILSKVKFDDDYLKHDEFLNMLKIKQDKCDHHSEYHSYYNKKLDKFIYADIKQILSRES